MAPGTPSRGIKQNGREADHFSLYSADVRNAWIYTSTPPYIFIVWYLVKHRDFTFSFILLYLVLLRSYAAYPELNTLIRTIRGSMPPVSLMHFVELSFAKVATTT